MTLENLIADASYFGLALTVAAYLLAQKIWLGTGRRSLLHPVLLTTIFVGLILLALRLPYGSYSEQTQPLTLGLGLVVVLLAVPLRRNWGALVDRRYCCGLALLIGASVSIATAVVFPLFHDAGPELLATVLPKSATAAVAVGISENLGGHASVTAVIVIATGIVGAVLGPLALDVTGVKDDRAQGFALGAASHAIGTARALQISDRAGAFAAVGMVLNAVLMVLASPVLFQWLA